MASVFDRRSQRHTPRARFNIRRESLLKKHSSLFFDDDIEDDSHFKENVKPMLPVTSPSVAKPARASSPSVAKPSAKRFSVVVDLPATATWGMKAKLQRSAEWVLQRDREILDEVHSAETLPSKAKLPTKSGPHGSAERKEKIKQRSLRRKYWIKSDKARRAARKQHVLAEMQPEAEAAPAPEMVDMDERGDGDGGDGGGVGKAKPAPRVRQSAYWTKRHEKNRRQARRAARDRKCFDPFDHVESIHLEPAVDEAPKMKKRALRPMVLKPEHVRLLLSSESAGPPVSDLFHTGVVLSNEAVRDLQLMLAGQGVARALAKAVSAPPLKIRSAKDLRGRGLGHSKACKTPPPAKAYPTKPEPIGPRGKRSC